MESIESGKRILDLVSNRIVAITSGKMVLVALAFIIIFGALAGWVVSIIRGRSGRSPAL